MLITPTSNKLHTAAFAELANAGFTYNWERGPAQVRNMEDALSGGLNCVSLSHLAVTRLLGITLPPDLHGNEMLLDLNGPGRVLRPVTDLRVAQPGDIVFLGLERRPDAQRRFSPQYDDDGHMTNSFDSGFRHVAVVTNELDSDTGELKVMDISMDKATRIAPLSEVMTFEQHAQLYGIGRLVVAGEYNIPKGEVA